MNNSVELGRIATHLGQLSRLGDYFLLMAIAEKKDLDPTFRTQVQRAMAEIETEVVRDRQPR